MSHADISEKKIYRTTLYKMQKKNVTRPCVNFRLSYKDFLNLFCFSKNVIGNVGTQ